MLKKLIFKGDSFSLPASLFLGFIWAAIAGYLISIIFPGTQIIYSSFMPESDYRIYWDCILIGLVTTLLWRFWAWALIVVTIGLIVSVFNRWESSFLLLIIIPLVAFLEILPPVLNKKTPMQSKIKKDKNFEESMAIIRRSEGILFQSNDPNTEMEFSDSLMKYPQASIRAISSRGWSKRGAAAEATNLFLIRVLIRIYKESDPQSQKDALNALISIFKTPDDNTAGWSDLLQSCGDMLARHKIIEAKEKFKELKSSITGKNVQAVDYALNVFEEN